MGPYSTKELVLRGSWGQPGPLQDGEWRCLGFWFALRFSVSLLLLPYMFRALSLERDVCSGFIYDGHAVKSSANIYW